MYLDTTSKALEIVLAGAITTSQLEWTVDFIDTQSGNTFSPVGNIGLTNSTTGVTMVPAPAASTQRKISNVTVFNSDTASATVTIRIFDGTNRRRVVTYALPVGNTLVYTPEAGWSVFPTATGSAVVGANPTATGSDVAVNGVATTFMRSDAAPLIQKVTNSVFGLAKPDNQTIQAISNILSQKVNGFNASNPTGSQPTGGNGAYAIVKILAAPIDTMSAYSTSTGKWTPTVAGTYLAFATGFCTCSGSSITSGNLVLNKNGTRPTGTTLALSSSGPRNAPDTATNAAALVTIVAMNGSTDWLELDSNISASSGPLVSELTQWGAIQLSP